MIIDIHNHIGEPWGTDYQQTPDELLARMESAQIDRAVVMPFPYGNFENDYTARAVRLHADRFIGAVMIAPWRDLTPEVTIRRYVEEEGFRAIYLHPSGHGFKMSEQSLLDGIMATASELNLPLLVYSGDELHSVPHQLMVAAEANPTVNMVMLHSGFMMNTPDAIMVGQRCGNVYLEHSSSISTGVRWSVDRVGADRTLLGSDSPYMDPIVERYKVELTIPDPSERALVLGGNAARLLGLGSN